MLTISKRWAIVTGFVLVGFAILAGAFWSRSHQFPTFGALTTLVAPSAPPTAAPLTAAPPTAAQAPAAAPALPTIGKLVPPSPDQATASPPEPAKPGSAPQPEVPHFDIVRVEPSGETVLAGQGAPNASVELLASGQVVAQAQTDASGRFVMLPPPLKPGDYALSLRQPGVGASPSESTQSVVVSVPEKGKGQVVVALAEPGRPTKLLSPPPVAPPPAIAAKPAPADVPPKAVATRAPETAAAVPPAAPAKAPALAVRSVELENGNGFFASGAAAPGTKLRVYLNNSHLADVVAGPDGNWSVTIRKGLTGGHYVIRADADSGGAKVTARVEVPFDVPVAMAEAPTSLKEPAAAVPSPAAAAKQAAVVPSPPAATTPPPVVAGPAAVAPAPVAAASPPVAPAKPSADGPTAPVTASSKTDAVIEEVSTALVHSGDNLWDISRVRLGQGRRYTTIYAANVAQIRNPNLIYPGQIFVVPTHND